MAKRFNYAKATKATGNEYVYAPNDPRGRTDFIDTGSYALNAALSGSVFGGAPDNRSVLLCGPTSSGKSYLTMRMAKRASELGYFILKVDSESDGDESAFHNFGFKERGVDFEILKIKTVEDLRIQLYAYIDQYKEYIKGLSLEEFETRDKLLILIDSIGFLGTKNSEKNLKEGKVVQQLKLPQQLKEFFRDITIDLNVLKVPLFLITHTYELLDPYASSSATVDVGKTASKVSGGSGPAYSSSVILHLEPKQKREETKVYSDKDGKEVTRKVASGTYFSIKVMKSRFVRAGSSVDVYLDYDKGLNKNFGLQKFCEGTLVEKVSRGSKGSFYKLLFKKNPDGSCEEVKSYVAEIPNMLPQIDEVVAKMFKFGNNEAIASFDEDEVELTDESSTEEE